VPNNSRSARFGAEGFSFIEIESEINRRHDEEKGDDVVPARYLPEQQPGYHHEDHDGDAFLHDFELDQAEVVRADTVGGYLK
jgi:hypothetical protein